MSPHPKRKRSVIPESRTYLIPLRSTPRMSSPLSNNMSPSSHLIPVEMARAPRRSALKRETNLIPKTNHTWSKTNDYQERNRILMVTPLGGEQSKRGRRSVQFDERRGSLPVSSSSSSSNNGRSNGNMGPNRRLSSFMFYSAGACSTLSTNLGRRSVIRGLRRSASLPCLGHIRNRPIDAAGPSDLNVRNLGYAWVEEEDADDHDDGDQSFDSRDIDRDFNNTRAGPIFANPFSSSSYNTHPPHAPFLSDSDTDRPGLSPSRQDLFLNRPAIARYRSAPESLHSQSGLNIVLPGHGFETRAAIDPRSVNQDESIWTGFNTPSTPMSRQLKRVPEVLSRMTPRTNAPRLPPVTNHSADHRSRSGRFDSIVSFRTRKGSWAAVSVVDWDGSTSLNYSLDEEESDALDSILLPLADRQRFNSVDTAMQNHLDNGGIWGKEGGSPAFRFPNGPAIVVGRRGTEGAIPVSLADVFREHA